MRRLEGTNADADFDTKVHCFTSLSPDLRKKSGRLDSGYWKIPQSKIEKDGHSYEKVRE